MTSAGGRRLAAVLIAGIGSAQGDDQLGWMAAEHLSQQLAKSPSVVARRAMIPLDVLDWLDGVRQLHLCDACPCSSERILPGTVARIPWMQDGSKILTEAPDGSPDPGRLVLSALRGSGTHDFGIGQMLQLAEAVGILPPDVTVWAIAGTDFQPGDPVSSGGLQAVQMTVDRILSELPDA